MNPLGLYHPGDSLLHRAPAGPKLVGLLVLVGVVVLLDSPAELAGPLGAVAVGFAVARIGPRRLWRSLVGLLGMVVLVVVVQVLLLGPGPAAVLGLRLAASLGAATLFTLTTRVDAVVDAVERGLGPLRRFGFRPDRVGLVVGLTVAAVGTLSGIAAEVRAAARARGADRSVLAFAVPFLVRTLRHADELGEALAARGTGEHGDGRHGNRRHGDRRDPPAGPSHPPAEPSG